MNKYMWISNENSELSTAGKHTKTHRKQHERHTFSPHAIIFKLSVATNTCHPTLEERLAIELDRPATEYQPQKS